MKKTLLTLVAICTFGIMQMNAQITSYPYVYDFENETVGPTGCNPSYTMVEAGWLNAAGDDMDWTNDNNTTGSTNTGPTADHTGNGGRYMYLEASCSANRIAYLETPVFDLTGAVNPFLSLWYHKYGADMGDLVIEIDTTGTGTWINLVTIAGQTQTVSADPWLETSISLASYSNATNAKFRITGNTLLAGFDGDIAIDDFMIESVLGNDAGVVSIDMLNPITPGTQNVDVTLQNFGALNLTTADIEWSIDGTAQTTFAWTGNEATDSTDAATIGTHNFLPGLTKVKAWTALPNGVLDSANGNDTTEMLFCTPLIGTYTLAPSGGDFSTFGELGDMLSNCGVAGNVIVNVAPGTYSGRMILDHIPGTSSSATVTINGGSADSVTLANTTGFSNIYFDGADWTTIKNITLENLGINDCYGVQLRDSAMNNTIDSCVINLETTATALNDVIGISASGVETSDTQEGLNAYWTTVSNCQINGGEQGIHFEGQAASRNVGNSFINNTLNLCEDYGFYMDDQDSITISGNTVTNLRNANADGIYIFDIMMYDISYNNVVNAPDWGMYIADGNFDAVPTSRGVVSNNMISSLTDYGVYFDDVEETDVFHNTFANVSTFNAAFRVNDIDGLDVRNNIFYSDGDFALDASDPIAPANNTFDYNSYYTTAASPNLVDDGFTVHADLLAWQAALPAANVNSVEIDPVFVSSSDLHALSPMIVNLGDNSVGILDDIDGETRPMGAAVDMGADEFVPYTDNAVFVAYYEPASGICGDSLTDVKVIIRNLGNTITNMNINVNVSGDITANLPFTYTGPLAFNEMDTVSIGTFNSYWGVNFNLDGYVALTGDQDTSNDTLATSMYAIPYEPQGVMGYACDGADTAVIGALALPGTAYFWYDAATGGTQVGSGNTYTIPSVAAQSTYYAEYANNADSIETTYAGGNSCGGGVMFDVTGINTVSINGASVSSTAGAGTPIAVTVHYIANGAYLPNTTNAAAWTTLGTYNVVSAGNGNPTFVDFGGASISIPAGATYAMYLEYPSAYTNGNNIYANADLSINVGVGLCSSFGGVNNPRGFNGALHYGTTACSSIRTPVTIGYDTSATAAFTYTLATTNGTVDFDATASTHTDSVMWDFGDGNMSTSLTPSHSYAGNASYTACLYAYSNCNIDTLCQTFNVTSVGVEELNEAGTVKVFPNPNKGRFTLDLTNYNQDDVTVIVFNQLGKVVYNRSYSSNDQGQQHAIDLSAYSNGVYFLKLASDKEVTTKKIIIQK